MIIQRKIGTRLTGPLGEVVTFGHSGTAVLSELVSKNWSANLTVTHVHVHP